MLPFKFKSRKVEEIIFRNAATRNQRFYIKVHPNMQSVLFQTDEDENESEDDTLGKVYHSAPTERASVVSAIESSNAIFNSEPIIYL